MEEDNPQVRFLKRVEEVLKRNKKTKKWLNTQVFGNTPAGVPKNNLFRPDQKQTTLTILHKVSHALNRSVYELLGENAKSAPGSTISPRPNVPYEQESEHIGHGAAGSQDKEGLHASTHKIDIDGEDWAVSVYPPRPEWIRQAFTEIMESDDSLSKAALDLYLRVLTEKIQQRNELEGLRRVLTKTVSVHRPPKGVGERRASHKELTKILRIAPSDIFVQKPRRENEEPKPS